jgi:hypothetical protein
MVREVVEQAPEDGRGAPRDPPKRALTLAEKLYREHIIGVDEWLAAGQFRNMHVTLENPSEGVSSYGLAPGGSSPHRKADRKAKRMTGVEISESGEISRGPSQANRSQRWRYNDALFAMAGVHTDEGDKVLDAEAARIMIEAVTYTEDLPTQIEIGRIRGTHRSGKQLSAIGATVVKENLRRLAMHFKLIKGDPAR